MLIHEICKFCTSWEEQRT